MENEHDVPKQEIILLKMTPESANALYFKAVHISQQGYIL